MKILIRAANHFFLLKAPGSSLGGFSGKFKPAGPDVEITALVVR